MPVILWNAYHGLVQMNLRGDVCRRRRGTGLAVGPNTSWPVLYRGILAELGARQGLDGRADGPLDGRLGKPVG